MPTEQSEALLERLFTEMGESIPYAGVIDILQDELDVSEGTAKRYISGSARAERVTMDDGEIEVQPSDVIKDSFVENDDLNEREVGPGTGNKYANLEILQDVGHDEIPRHAETGYIKRRMSQDEDSVLRKRTDIEVVTAAMSDPDFSTLLIGKHGVGKDQLIEHVCAKTNRPMIRLVANDDPDFVDLLTGTYQPTADGGFEHRKGLLTIALENGYTFVLDEFNALSGKVQTMLNKILEDADSSELVMPETNEVIQPHDEFSFVATMNPNEVGYGGREMLDAATSSRFIPIRIPPLSEDAERRVVAQETPFDKDDPALDTLLRDDGGVVTGIRSLHKMGKTSMWVSTRDVIQVARMAGKLGGVEPAAEVVLVGRANPEDKAEIKDHINSQNW